MDETGDQMATKKIQYHATRIPGIRYKTIEGRLHGKALDKYFMIRHTFEGKTHNEGLGWTSEGWTLSKANIELAKLIENHRTGSGYQTLKEARKLKQAELAAKEEARQQAEEEARKADALVYDTVFADFLAHNTHLKDLRTMRSLHKNWISPFLGKKRLDEIQLPHLQVIKKAMDHAGLSPRTMQAVKVQIGSIYTHALERKIYAGENPARNFLTNIKLNNRRERYLTREEARLLLDELKKTSSTTYQMSLISLNTGMRFGEIAALRWMHLHLDEGWLHVVDTKNAENRKIPLTPELQILFKEIRAEVQIHLDRCTKTKQPPIRGMEPEDLVFPVASRAVPRNTVMPAVSRTFSRTVENLGFNEGVTDRRFRIVFHSLRHTAASWMVNAGVSLPVIAEILGHKTLTMTQRYSHVGDEAKLSAINVLSTM